ncbi:MAG: helix-turn-helix domain-containing protein [Bacteroidota bacterium]
MSTKKGHKSRIDVIQNKYNRNFSEAFKRTRVAAIVDKQISISQTVKVYGVSRSSVYNWIYRYSGLDRGVKQVVQMESEAQKTLRLQKQVAELERIIGQKQLALDIANKTIELASEELGYDLKKKYASKSSNTTGPTDLSTPTP